MYKIKKNTSTTSCVMLVNTETNAEVNLGKLTPTLVHILGEYGYHVMTHIPDVDLAMDRHLLSMDTAWCIDIDADTKNKLVSYALPMIKPKKAKKEEVPTEEKTEEKKEIVDVLDLIYSFTEQ